MASRDGCPEFSMFEKMTNCTKNWTCREFSKIKEWVATEKIHGSNFSLTVWEEDHEVVVKMAKRSSYLGDEENFFNVRRQAALVQEMEECSRRVWLSVQKQESEVEAVVVYGELFGGYYPHHDVQKVSGAKAVQKQVVYCPDLKFSAFDVLLCRSGQRRDYLSFDDAVGHLEGAGFMYCKPLCRGSLEYMIGYPLGFPTTLPAMFGLPPVHDNLAEGIVIKPAGSNQVLENSYGDEERVIFKRKLDRFEERRPILGPVPIPSGAKGGRGGRGSKASVSDFSASDCEVLRYEMLALVSEQRIVNTISKLGIPESDADWKTVLKRFKKDVMEDLERENKELVTECRKSPVNWKNIAVEMHEECMRAVNAHRRKLEQEQ